MSVKWVRHITKKKLEIFERKILQKNRWAHSRARRIRYNLELYQLYKELPILEFANLQRLCRDGHVV